MRTRAATLALAAVLAAAAPAGAGEAERLYEEARRHMAALRYGEAAYALERSLHAGESGPARVREIYRLAGELAAGLGRQDEAETHFRRLLVLEPGFTLPGGSSPKLTEPLNAARSFVNEQGPLRLRHRSQGRTVVLIVENDPLSMVRGARARYRSGGEEGAALGRGRERVALEIPGEGPTDVVLEALDPYGNTLAVLGSDEVPIRLAGEGGGRRRGGEPRPLYARWAPWAGVALFFGAAGGGFAYGVLEAQSDLDDLNRRSEEEPFMHDFAEAKEIERRGHRFAVLANVSFAAAAVSGAVAASLLARDLLSDDSDRAGASAGLSPTRGGFAAILRLRY